MRLLSILIAVLVLTQPAGADWQLRCDADKCRAIAYADVNIAPHRRRILVEFTDHGKVTVSALVTREQYRSEFSSNPATDESFGGREYIRGPNFFSNKLRARIRVDGHLIGTARPDPQGFIAFYPAGVLIDAAKHGHELQIQYAVGTDGYGPPLSFDLMGLEAALSKFHHPGFIAGQLPIRVCTDAERRRHEQEKETGLVTFQSCRLDSRPPFSEADEVGVVALLLDTANQQGVRSTDLSAVQNPLGSGSWVYVKGRKGFLWFVNDGDVVAVSVLAKSVTPDALDPYEVSAGIWGSTHIDADNAFRTGTSIIPPQ
jgi:hypothetical protein